MKNKMLLLCVLLLTTKMQGLPMLPRCTPQSMTCFVVRSIGALFCCFACLAPARNPFGGLHKEADLDKVIAGLGAILLATAHKCTCLDRRAPLLPT